MLELKHVNTTDGNITVEWEEVANRSGVIGGDFNWNIDLGNAAGSETYRFAVRGYEGGDLLCPPSQYNPDETCAIPFDITIDTYEPNLLDMQVLSPGTDANVDSNWRTLLDDTGWCHKQPKNPHVKPRLAKPTGHVGHAPLG